MEKCGCVAITTNNSIRIRYCPLHQAAPALLAVLTERIGIPDSADFANDLQEIAEIVEFGGFKFNTVAAGLRAKAQAIRAAIAEAKGSDN